ncbi:hypothetical protein [Microvirga massiliensis]|uniref:hypothetical protein n=1 Tax=Microvirga massiliensis TaxID=1033741 RepID=UPI00062B9FC0|nr:hypothetical protein [Microvirga massiliensis]
MGSELLIGAISLAIGVALMVVALPQKSGEPARFLAWNSSLGLLYPILPMLFVVIGVSLLIQAAV